MKLVVFVGGEVIRLALQNTSIESNIALARKDILVPKYIEREAETSKMTSILLEDWENPYPDFVHEQLKGANACAWSVPSYPYAWWP
jgi:hypothetical protein